MIRTIDEMDKIANITENSEIIRLRMKDYLCLWAIEKNLFTVFLRSTMIMVRLKRESLLVGQE